MRTNNIYVRRFTTGWHERYTTAVQYFLSQYYCCGCSIHPPRWYKKSSLHRSIILNAFLLSPRLVPPQQRCPRGKCTNTNTNIVLSSIISQHERIVTGSIQNTVHGLCARCQMTRSCDDRGLRFLLSEAFSGSSFAPSLVFLRLSSLLPEKHEQGKIRQHPQRKKNKKRKVDVLRTIFLVQKTNEYCNALDCCELGGNHAFVCTTDVFQNKSTREKKVESLLLLLL